MYVTNYVLHLDIDLKTTLGGEIDRLLQDLLHRKGAYIKILTGEDAAAFYGSTLDLHRPLPEALIPLKLLL